MALGSLFMSNHIAQQAGGFEAQRQNNGLLFVYGLNGNSTGLGDYLTLSLESFTIPSQRNDPIEMPYLNNVHKIAGQATVDEFSVNVRDFFDTPTRKILEEWRRQVYNPVTGAIGLAATYKKRGKVELYGPNGSLNYTYDLIGLFPTALAPGEVDMSGNDKMLMELQLQCDRVVETGSVFGGLSRAIDGVTQVVSAANSAVSLAQGFGL